MFPGMKKWVAAAVVVASALAIPARAQGKDTLLTPEDVKKQLPASVYYHGQTATTQLRNSGGVKFADGSFLLATLVDTSGYSSDVQTKYQAYFITEDAITVGGTKLPAGIYGIGFLAGDKFVVTDVGGHDVICVASVNDAALARPRPLQIVADAAGGYRLYAGHSYVTIQR